MAYFIEQFRRLVSNSNRKILSLTNPIIIFLSENSLATSGTESVVALETKSDSVLQLAREKKKQEEEKKRPG